MRPYWSPLLNVALLALLLCGARQVAASTAPVLDFEDTVYVGTLSDDRKVARFLGVPFAQPPTGDLRWQAPQPFEQAGGTVEARTFAPACMQGSHIVDWYRDVASSFGADPAVIEAPGFSEDCLYLNIWTPAAAETGTLPVLVYIHGGSNKGGWPYEPNYIGENLARHGVVVVTIAYRLGVFGFFAHPGLEQANFGLLDQMAALRWVGDHIAAAGGDPANVTVMGESAGANNITHLLASPLANGLFSRAIHQSAGWALLGRTTHEQHAARGMQLQQNLTGSRGSIQQLRQLPAAELLAGAEEVYAGHFFDPVIDGHSLTRPVAEVLSSGSFPPIDLLIGSNADEWLMYLDRDQSPEQWIQDELTPAQGEAIRPIVRSLGGGLRALDRLVTARQFVCPSMSLAASIATHGGRSWFYYFARQREGQRAATMGAYHGAELPYVFDTHDSWLPTDAVDKNLTDAMMSYWVNFARSGNPNGPGLPPWPPFDRNKGNVLRLDARISAEAHVSLPLCDILLP